MTGLGDFLRFCGPSPFGRSRPNQAALVRQLLDAEGAERTVRSIAAARPHDIAGAAFPRRLVVRNHRPWIPISSPSDPTSMQDVCSR